MIGLPLAFLAPWMLLALALLPALWWLLRLMPPRPRRFDFPPLRLLLEGRTEETPSTTPWWLMLLRLGIAALIILALAVPMLNPSAIALSGRGPVVVLLDQGWAAAPGWKQESETAADVIDAADHARRPLALVSLADPPADITLLTAAEARDRLRALTPQPSPDDRAGHLGRIQRLLAANPGADVYWLSSGLDEDGGRAFAAALAKATSRLVVATPSRTARGLADAENDPAALTVHVLRAEGRGGETGLVRAYDLRGRPLGEARYRFSGTEPSAEARLTLPIELRNDVARLDIAGERSAGAVQLLDDRWKRKTVGIVSGTTADTAEPLLSPNYYLARALQPFAEIRNAGGVSPSAAVQRFADGGVSVMMMADVGNLTPAAHATLEKWIADGGVLVRFAGPRLAAADKDDLVPVHLRHGGRVLGGTLAWGTPQPLGAFPAGGPFAGLTPEKDIRVERQVLAEPDPDLGRRTWAVLADGTPLVTARRDGKGLLVLFHVTGDTTWSNLPLSGTFVEMLRRVVALAGRAPPPTTSAAGAAESTAADAAPAASKAVLAPTRTLDGYGAFRNPPPTARPVPARGLAAATAEHPPGIYGPSDGFVAVNVLPPKARLAALDLGGLTLTRRAYAAAQPIALAPWLFVAAFALLLVDTLVMLWLSGAAGRLRRKPGAALLVLAAGGALALGWPGPLHAESPALTPQQKFAMEASLTTHLAYVVTGDRELDETTRAGLVGLSQQLAARTAFEPGEPIGVDPAHDELAFFPLIYWAVPTDAEAPSSATLAKLDSYMKRGGTILFDTRDALYATPGATSPGTQALRRILAGLDVPELEPVPPDHVLTKAFYLLTDFPGRYDGGTLWVEALPDRGAGDTRPVRAGDGVSPILITSNDLAGAWAVDADGHPMFPTVPASPRQREMAYRAGINIVMYALTGNYKADQVHVPAILERLGQ